MLSSTRLEPRANSRTFLMIRFKSEADGVGLRIPTEFTHKTRLCFASRCMMCFLLRGSPSQSLQKQMMSCPLIICTCCLCKVHAKGDGSSGLRESFSLWGEGGPKGRMRVDLLPSPAASRHPLPEGEGPRACKPYNRQLVPT